MKFYAVLCLLTIMVSRRIIILEDEGDEIEAFRAKLDEKINYLTVLRKQIKDIVEGKTMKILSESISSLRESRDKINSENLTAVSTVYDNFIIELEKNSDLIENPTKENIEKIILIVKNFSLELKKAVNYSRVFYYILIASALLLIFGIVSSYLVFRKKENQEDDHEAVYVAAE